MKTAEYWQKRFEQLAQRQFNKADEYARELRKEYDRAIRSIQRDIEVFYQRYADNNGIVDLAEAKRQLNAKELQEFHWTLEEFMAKAKDNADGRWTKQLDNAYFRIRVSRFEALQTLINQQVEILAGSKQQGTGELLGSAYTDTYYRTLFEIQLGTGIGASFAHVGQQGLETVLKAKLDGQNWSERIWNDRAMLKQELYTKLSQAFIRGDSIDRTTQELAKRMNVSYSRAYRLVQTETAFFVEQATMNSYSESGVVDRYEYLAVLDNRTSDICRAMDGKIFKISEKEVGVNCPPLHCHCRSTTVPYFDDEEDVDERLARDPKTRETYTVPSDMTYDKWHKQYVVDKYGKEQADVMQKKAANAYSDQEQFSRYKKILGKDAPKTFDDFQDLKYTEAEKWSLTKLDYSRRTQLHSNPDLALPNAAQATAADGKFEKYLFSPANKVGAAKGAAFTSRLGYSLDNWKGLQEEILARAKLNPAAYKKTNPFGDLYEQKMVLYGENGKPANVVVGWIKEGDSMRMTSAYIKEVKPSADN